MNNSMYIFYTVLCILSLFLYTNSEIFTSLAHMEDSLKAEQMMVSKLRQYIADEKKRLDMLENVADSYGSHSSQAMENPSSYLGNPINAYLFVKKFTLDWNKAVEDPMKNNPSYEKFNENVNELRQFLPNMEDFTGAVKAIYRLQEMYDIPAKEIAEGNVGGVKTKELTADGCFEIGRIAYQAGDYYHAYHWFAVAKDRLANEVNKTKELPEVLDYLAWTAHELGNERYALQLTEQLIELEPDHVRAKNNRLDFIELVKKENETGRRVKRDLTITSHYVPKPTAARDDNIDFRNYKRLCKGLDVKPREKVHVLVCRYRHNNNPILILDPAKEEEVYRKAGMVLFHDIVSDREMKVIKSLATPRLRRATVHNPTTGVLETASYRITKTAWFDENEDPTIDRVQSRIKAATGLDLKSADHLQVANYGIGGHYDPHFDFSTRDDTDLSETEIEHGNRVATFLLYMTDVDAGGATVFPRIDIRVLPNKGKAVFWYNLRRSGKGIYETRHAACPVLVGTKWVSNKWIRERGQEFRRPCGLTEDE